MFLRNFMQETNVFTSINYIFNKTYDILEQNEWKHKLWLLQ